MTPIHLHELIEKLDLELFPRSFDDVCPNGIQISNTGTITKIATAVSANLETIEKAVALQVNALIVHHGIFLKNELPTIEGTKYKKIKLLIENNIALICYHLPLDAQQVFGNNWRAARDLGLEKLVPFADYKGAAIGVQGSIGPKSCQQFKEILESYYQHPAYAAQGKKEIRTVAIVSGSGHKYLKEAALKKIDCLVTGSFDEPAWDIAHEEGIAFFALGHTATEKVGPRALADFLRNELQIESYFIDTENQF